MYREFENIQIKTMQTYNNLDFRWRGLNDIILNLLIERT